MEVIGANKYITPPDKLYKYFSNLNNAYIAVRGKLYLDVPKSFNDPFEYDEDSSVLNTAGSDEGAPVMQEKPVSLKLKEACFSEINDSILMWAYYGRKHEGVCLEYDINELKNNCVSIRHDDYPKDLYKGIRPVHYSPNRWENSATIEDKVFRKADVWHHELEWRLAVRIESDKEQIPFDIVSAVYFGARTDMSQVTVRKILIACSIHNIPVYQFVCDPKEYKLIPTKWTISI